MAIPEAIKTNFNTLVKAVKQEDIALLECRIASGRPILNRRSRWSHLE
jgi:hypothetical protein